MTTANTITDSLDYFKLDYEDMPLELLKIRLNVKKSLKKPNLSFISDYFKYLIEVILK